MPTPHPKAKEPPGSGGPYFFFNNGLEGILYFEFTTSVQKKIGIFALFSVIPVAPIEHCFCS